MKTIFIRLDNRIWKKLYNDKNSEGLTWEEYILKLFAIKQDCEVII